MNGVIYTYGGVGLFSAHFLKQDLCDILITGDHSSDLALWLSLASSDNGSVYVYAPTLSSQITVHAHCVVIHRLMPLSVPLYCLVGK